MLPLEKQKVDLDQFRFIFLSPEQYYLIAPFFEAEGVPTPDPTWSKIIAALTLDGKVAGFIVLQLVAHAEPIVIAPEYRGQGLWEPLAAMMDSYIEEMQVAGAYTQPVNEASAEIARRVGFEECPHKLFVKVYRPEVVRLMPQIGAE